MELEAAMIQLKDISKKFDSLVVLSQTNILVPKGESFCVIGPSGQGKSVLLKLIAGILRPDTGQILIEGQDLHTIALVDRAKLMRKMGMLFQKNALFDSMTCFENVAFPLRETTAKSDAEIKDIAEGFLEAVGIPHARDLFPDEISGGMQKRLGIARALALNPQLILYDDPTAGLDPITSRKIIDLIIGLQQKHNSTIVAITNDMNRAYQMAHRIGMIVDGELVVTGTPEQTRNHADPRVHQFIRGALEGPLTRGAESGA
ncbi:MAG: ABC transporter ATP-binding protein [Bdellovibrionales bacterium]|nr:ABC transporter ATP-binding protein [Bdellovibrionales bacterium]